MSTKVEQILERYEAAKKIREESNSILEEIGRYVWPNSRDMEQAINQPPGQVRTLDVMDSTARTAAHRMTAGLFSFIMPAGQDLTWFEYEAQSAEDRENDDIRTWLSNSTDAVHSELLRSNFQRAMFMTLKSMVVFGTGCIALTLARNKKDLFFRNYHIGDIFFEENDWGQLDVVFRRIRYTNRQAVQKFGIKKVSEKVRKEYEAKKFNTKHEYVHAVFPRDDVKPEKVDASGMPFESIYIEVESKIAVDEGGFKRQVYLIGRLELAPNELLGRGPAHDLLPEIRMLNDMRATYIEGAESAHTPPLLAEDDSIVGQPVTGPQGVLYYRQGSPIPVPLKTGFDAIGLGVDIEKQRLIIKDGYFNDLFDALENIRNISSATEAEIRQAGKLVIVAPMVAGQQKELFDPLAVQSLQLLSQKGGKEAIKPAPDDFEFDIVYQGRLAKAMSQLQSNAIELWLGKWTALEEIWPVSDNVDMDEAARLTANNSGVPGQVMRSIKDREAMRKERKAKQDMAEGAEIGATAAKAIKDVSGAVDPTSVVAQL
jgi:hypothetical protein